MSGKIRSKRLEFSYNMSKMVRTAVLMMNLGGPKTPELVKPFLVRMFKDHTFIQIPLGLGPFLAKLRADGKVRKQYEAIGGSPLEKWTRIQGGLLTELLDKNSPKTAPHKIYPCFRYCSPDSQEVCTELAHDNPEQMVAFSQYPQYSCMTTGNSLRELKRFLPKDIPVSVVTSWSSHPSFISSWVSLITQSLGSFTDPHSVTIVFTAHSVPASVIWRGDPYAHEVAATVSRVMESLPNPHYLF